MIEAVINRYEKTPVCGIEVINNACPQCGHYEMMSERRTANGNASSFTACPLCGHLEEIRGTTKRSRKGFGVFVLEADRGMVTAGVFPSIIPDDKVPTLLARFMAMEQTVRFVTRWNETESRLEVLYNQAA